MSPADPATLVDQAISYAALGTESLQDFWLGLTGTQQKQLAARKDEFKELARMADDRQNQPAEESLLDDIQIKGAKYATA